MAGESPITTLTTANDEGILRALGGFESVEVVRSVEAVTSSFKVAGMWPPAGAAGVAGSTSPGDRSIASPGRECIVDHSIGGVTAKALRGWIDLAPVSMSSDEHTIEVSGRSFTGDLVDCAAIGPTDEDGNTGASEWRDATDRTIIIDIADRYGIDVQFKVPAGTPIPYFSLESGEKASEAIERVAAMRSLLVYDDALGRLVVDRVRDEFAAEALDVASVEAVKITQDASRIFGQIEVRSQEPGIPGKNVSGKSGTFALAEDTDSFPPSRPPRKLVIEAETPSTAAQCMERANWEHATRFGQAIKIELTLAGWTTPDEGVNIWEVNKLVHYTDGVHGVDDVFLISEVQFSYSIDEGHKSRLLLQPPAAFDRLSPEQRVKTETDSVLNAGPGKFPLEYLRGTAESFKAWRAARRAVE